MVGSVPKNEGVRLGKLRQSLFAYFFGQLQVEISQWFESKKQAVVETECGVIDVHLVDDVIVFSVVVVYF